MLTLCRDLCLVAIVNLQSEQTRAVGAEDICRCSEEPPRGLGLDQQDPEQNKKRHDQRSMYDKATTAPKAKDLYQETVNKSAEAGDAHHALPAAAMSLAPVHQDTAAYCHTLSACLLKARASDV